MPEAESLQSLTIVASVENELVDERSHKEIQPKAELLETYAKEVPTPQDEFNVKKEIHEV